MRTAFADFLRRSALISVAALALMWPAAFNGGPFFTTDSIAYIRGPDQAIIKLFGPGRGTLWSVKPLGMGFRGGVPTRSAEEAARSPPMAGRSIYYGVLANLGARTGGFWATIAAQAVAAAFALHLLCTALGWRRASSYLIAVAMAALATPLGFFVSCLMPDVWAPILILVAAALAAGGERLSRDELIMAFLLLAFAAAAHTTHMLLLAAIAAAGGLLFALRGRLRFRLGAPGMMAGFALAALAIGAISVVAFNLAVTRIYHAPPVQAPFLTARLVGDGRPGEAWLRRHCPASGFQACAYVSRLPMTTDDFLWSTEPSRSVFWTASPSQRAALGAEQFRFAASVLRDDPTGVVRQFAADAASQFADIGLSDFNHTDRIRGYIGAWMVGPDAKVWRASMAYRQAWPISLLDGIETVSLAVGLGGLVLLGAWPRGPGRLRADDERTRILLAGFVIIVALAANAAICGGLSDIYGRYQARVTAPLILIGLIALWRFGSSAIGRRQRAHAGGPARA